MMSDPNKNIERPEVFRDWPEPKEPSVVPLDDPNVPESLVPIPSDIDTLRKRGLIHLRALPEDDEKAVWRRILEGVAPSPEGWQPIETALKDGTKIDLWAKAWLPAFDRFEFRRFADCWWWEGDSMSNRSPQWMELSRDWHPTHWMPLPAPPAAAGREDKK